MAVNIDLNNLVLLGIAALYAYSAYQGRQTALESKATRKIAEDTNALAVETKQTVQDTKANVHEIHIATNSMKDALVAAEKLVSFAEGVRQVAKVEANTADMLVDQAGDTAVKVTVVSEAKKDEIIEAKRLEMEVLKK